MSYNNDEAHNVNANRMGDELSNEELNETKIAHERPKEVEQQTKEQDLKCYFSQALTR